MGIYGNFSNNVYHSIYDSFTYVDKFGDPGFQYCVSLAQLWGIIALRLADYPLLPFNYREYAQFLQVSLVQLKSLDTNGTLDFSSMDNAITTINFAATSLDQQMQILILDNDNSKLSAFNDKLKNIEQKFLFPGGINGRPWYAHLIFAPGLYEGYASAVYPSIEQAIVDGTLAVAQQEILNVAFVINAAANLMNS